MRPFARESRTARSNQIYRKYGVWNADQERLRYWTEQPVAAAVRGMERESVEENGKDELGPNARRTALAPPA